MAPPEHWVEDSDERLVAESMAEEIRAALEGLPGRQREVVLLRDVDGLTSEEVCEVLDISEGNQRVLLHRGRSRLRQALESELGGA
jgi:RNA polymerase sigma-70 factor (ECF subfamily)